MAQHVLIVEDDPDGQALVSHVIDHLHLHHHVVGDAERASMHLFETGDQFDAVIINLALPGKDGWELLADIRENPSTAGLTCIAVTAFHTSKMRSEALRAGFDAYFAKPLDAVEFANELGTIL